MAPLFVQYAQRPPDMGEGGFIQGLSGIISLEPGSPPGR